MKTGLIWLSVAVVLSLSAQSALAQQIALVSSDASGIKGNNQSWRPDVSGDGRYVVLGSSASNLVTGTSPAMDVFAKDLVTGQIERVSKASDGTPGNSSSGNPKGIHGDC
jgi:hypothetical protein